MYREYLIQNTYIINNCCCFIDGDGLDIWAMEIIHATAALSPPFVITRIVDPGRVYPDSNPTIGKKKISGTYRKYKPDSDPTKTLGSGPAAQTRMKSKHYE